MRGSLRDASKIIFRMGRVKAIDKLIACSFDILHCTPFRTFSGSQTRQPRNIRALRVGVYCGLAAALRQERFQTALSELTAQRRDRACSLDLEAVIRKREVKNEGHCAHAYGAPARL
jgi:hypothetical protein